MQRRTLLRSAFAAGATLAAPAIVRADTAHTLRFVPQADPAILDPVVTTGLVSRNHGFLIFDTLYAVDEHYVAQPQMVAGHVISEDGLTWTMTLRPGLLFHDGTPVRSRDVIASLRRWGVRDTFGNSLMAIVDELVGPTDTTLRWRLKHPFPQLPDALGKVGSITAAIMPERLAATDPATPVSEMIGSGPFRFIAAEHVPGSRVVYQKFEGYVPRPDGVTSLLAGPKIVYLDRVEWLTIPDAATAAAALQQGEIDWWEQPIVDLLPTLKANKSLKVEVLDPSGAVGDLRFNQLYPPFDNPAIRRAILGAITQADFMTAIVGNDRSLWRDAVGFFPPGSPMANDVGMAALTGPRDLEASRRALTEAGYRGETVTLMTPTDFPSINAMSEVTNDLLKKLGMKVNYIATDWGSMLRRMANREPPDRGGYNLFCTYSAGVTQYNPAAHNFIRGSGDKATFGWSVSPKLEALRDLWFTAPDDAARLQIGRDMQAQAFIDVPYVPLGIFYQPTAYRSTLSGLLKGPPLFWNVKKA